MTRFRKIPRVHKRFKGGFTYGSRQKSHFRSTTMLILQLLEEKDMYGYEMIETLQKKSQNVFQLKAGTLYPLLHTLEGKGYLTSYEDSTGQKVRKYYSITKSGKNFLSQKKEEWKEYSAAVANILTSRLTGSADVISSYVPQLEG